MATQAPGTYAPETAMVNASNVVADQCRRMAAAILEWKEARTAVLETSISGGGYREKLDRLAKAEGGLISCTEPTPTNENLWLDE